MIGVAGLKSIGEVAARAWLEKNGVPSDSAKYLELSYSQMGPGLDSGRVDAVLAEEPAVTALLDSNSRVLARPYDVLAPEFLEGGYFATTDFVKAHPDVVKQFADAMAEAAVWANAHHAETATILAQVGKVALAPNVVRINYPPRVTAALIQPILDASAKYSVLKATYPASEIIAPGVGP